MRHVDEGTLLAIRDRGLVDAEARRHVEGCPTCSGTLAETRERARAVGRLLSSLDDGPVQLDTAKAEVRRRLDRRREAPRPVMSRLPVALGRAAALVILASGVVYALPGSPLRGWVSELRSPEETPVTVPVDATPAESIEVSVPAEGLRIVIVSAVPGQRVEVRLTDAGTASLTAPSGTRYSVSAEAARAQVTDGAVAVGLPRGSGPIIVELDGRMVLRSSGEGIEVFGDVVSRDGETVVFAAGPG